ncbi:MAG: cytochrome c [Vulcanimicrobiota bacterium]
MSNDFKADKIAREKPDPIEGVSARWLPVPPLLLTLFLGFGITYLWMQTDSLQFRDGDMRTPHEVRMALASEAGGGSLLELGETVYKRNCQACHQATGLGLGAAFPPLAGSSWVTGPPSRLSAIVLYGVSGEIEVEGTTYRGAMPSFHNQLSDDEIAAVATYIRSSWGNQADPVEPSLVAEMKQQFEREKPWGGQAELDQQDW